MRRLPVTRDLTREVSPQRSTQCTKTHLHAWLLLNSLRGTKHMSKTCALVLLLALASRAQASRQNSNARARFLVCRPLALHRHGLCLTAWFAPVAVPRMRPAPDTERMDSPEIYCYMACARRRHRSATSVNSAFPSGAEHSAAARS